MVLNLPKIEEKILSFWKKNNIFEKSISQRRKAKDFVFYEGPPTANAPPGLHHVLSRVFKDIICRYKTMRGFRVLRKAGWDTHGLPVEIQIEKKLGFKTKKDIENFGIAKFNEECQKSVWEYKKEWEILTERIGFWLDLKNAYITYDADYIETLWYILKRTWEKKLLVRDFKVVPWCPRCQTALSSHEVALGYQKIKEPAIFVKFKILNPKFENSFFLVWTTTPWTLLGNVAIAVNPQFDYVKVKCGNQFLILAKERAKFLLKESEILNEFKGKELIGFEYEPPFLGEVKEVFHFFKVLGADFVTLKEGTGLVHIAPAFGEEDFNLCREKIKGLKIPNPVDEEGKFKEGKWKGMFVKEADSLIIEELKNKGLLFLQEMYEHEYPFCWRCKTPLLYYVRKSWFIKMKNLKKKLIENNQKINWIPSFFKKGRFGEWLKEVKDWALSRERYWGTPLPIWECKNCGFLECIGSKKELLSKKFTKNTYFVLRHGEAISNLKKINSCWPEKFKNPLTKKGIEQVKKLIQPLKKLNIDLIYSSDLLRAKQTAEILGKALGKKVIYDKRIREFKMGKLNGLPIEKAGKFWDLQGKLSKIEYYLRRFKIRAPGGESFTDLKIRMYKFLKDIDKKYKGKKILIIGHEAPLSMLEGAVRGYSNVEIIKFREKKKLKNGEMRKIDFKIWPYDKKGDLNFHRPYVDEIKYICPKCGSLMERVPDVIDCWFDSGAMPFAQVHWPFSQKNEKVPPKLFPAHYICEGTDQTRGWFYTLLAISTLLNFGPPYKNVISVGLVLDEKGEKMSKSKGNVIDPWLMIKRYGTDTLRWYFFTVNQPYEPKRFSEDDLEKVYKRFILTFWNCFQFYMMYRQKNLEIEEGKIKPRLILDKWIFSRLNKLILKVTESLEKFDVTKAARLIEEFIIEDLSLWYIRRSRRRFQKPKSKEELKEALNVLKDVLLKLSRLSAPFIPFLSEEIFKTLKGNLTTSVHLENWPKFSKEDIDEKLEKKMSIVREIVSLALAERKKAKIKVRQPLLSLQINNRELIRENELLELIKEEVNVKKITFGNEFSLDTKITPELQKEGIVKEVLRYIQQMRKEAKFRPKDKVGVRYMASPFLDEVLKELKETILVEGKLEFFSWGGGKGFEREYNLNGEKIKLILEKIK